MTILKGLSAVWCGVIQRYAIQFICGLLFLIKMNKHLCSSSEEKGDKMGTFSAMVVGLSRSVLFDEL